MLTVTGIINWYIIKSYVWPQLLTYNVRITYITLTVIKQYYQTKLNIEKCTEMIIWVSCEEWVKSKSLFSEQAGEDDRFDFIVVQGKWD